MLLSDRQNLAEGDDPVNVTVCGWARHAILPHWIGRSATGLKACRQTLGRFIVQAVARLFPGIGQTTAAWATIREWKGPNALVIYSPFGKSSPAFLSHTNLLL